MNTYVLAIFRLDMDVAWWCRRALLVAVLNPSVFCIFFVVTFFFQGSITVRMKSALVAFHVGLLCFFLHVNAFFFMLMGFV